jgi:hypothetical protein
MDGRRADQQRPVFPHRAGLHHRRHGHLSGRAENGEPDRRLPVYDNAATWVDLATVESSTLHSNEAGIAHVGGSNFIVVKREGDATAVTHIYYSSDNCVTWTARAAIPIMGELERPRLLELDNGVLLFGRDQLGASVSDYTVVWYSADGGLTWGRKFYPDTTAFSDCGYCDVLQRADGKFYMLTYGGTTLTASVRSCVFEIA